MGVAWPLVYEPGYGADKVVEKAPALGSAFSCTPSPWPGFGVQDWGQCRGWVLEAGRTSPACPLSCLLWILRSDGIVPQYGIATGRSLLWQITAIKLQIYGSQRSRHVPIIFPCCCVLSGQMARELNWSIGERDNVEGTVPSCLVPWALAFCPGAWHRQGCGAGETQRGLLGGFGQ